MIREPEHRTMAAGTDGEHVRDVQRRSAQRALLDHALADVATGRLVVDAATARRFADLFASSCGRAQAVRRCLGPDAEAAALLWATLTCEMPAPQCADPAALLAVCALLRGDPPRALLATCTALDADPRHVLAGVVSAALHTSAGAPGLRRVLESTYGAS